MQEIFSRYRKAIITGGGVLLFLIAGLITMIFTDSGSEIPRQENSRPPESNQQSQKQTDNPAPPPTETTQPSRTLYVYITGEIRNPGVYKLSDDARIFQLVDMAGGFTQKADRESLNLAENLSDGSHVHIAAKSKSQSSQQSPRIPGIPASTPRNSAVTHPQSQSGRININTAGPAELESLPGIGPAIAQRIIDYRNIHGNFSRPEDLINVRGIGQAKLSQVLPHITAMNTGSRVTQQQSSAGLIDINRASQKELERLPGVGPVTAKRIIDYRQTHGNFTKAEDLTNIRGISQAKLDNIRGLIVIR